MLASLERDAPARLGGVERGDVPRVEAVRVALAEQVPLGDEVDDVPGVPRVAAAVRVVVRVRRDAAVRAGLEAVVEEILPEGRRAEEGRVADDDAEGLGAGDGDVEAARVEEADGRRVASAVVVVARDLRDVTEDGRDDDAALLRALEVVDLADGDRGEAAGPEELAELEGPGQEKGETCPTF